MDKARKQPTARQAEIILLQLAIDTLKREDKPREDDIAELTARLKKLEAQEKL